MGKLTGDWDEARDKMLADDPELATEYAKAKASHIAELEKEIRKQQRLALPFTRKIRALQREINGVIMANLSEMLGQMSLADLDVADRYLDTQLVTLERMRDSGQKSGLDVSGIDTAIHKSSGRLIDIRREINSRLRSFLDAE